MVDSSNVSDDRGEEAADAGRMAEAETIAEFIFESVLLKWEDVVRGKRNPTELCAFCAPCQIERTTCEFCFIQKVYGTGCGMVIEGKDPWDVLKILERDRETLIVACASFVLDHDITWKDLADVGLYVPPTSR